MMMKAWAKQWDLIKDGILVNYQAIRDQAHIIGLERIARMLLLR
jgi:predicted Zn-dependent protease